VIIRILSEGQYKLDSSLVDSLNDLDNRLVEVVGEGNEVEFRRLLTQMLDSVRERGQSLPVTELMASDLVLPEEDITLEEARQLFTGEGIIPG